MSAVLEKLSPATHTDSVLSPIESARAALDAARGELAALDQRIRGYEEELDERELESARHRAATVAAVGAGKSLPKAPRPKPSDAAIALPILRGQRKRLEERIEESAGHVRKACVEKVERELDRAIDAYADRATEFIGALMTMLALRALLDQAGVRGELPSVLYGDHFAIPALGKLRPIALNHGSAFIASHAIAQGELVRATAAVRERIEREVGKLTF